MDLATIQIKVDTREVNAANDEIGKLGKTGTKVGKDLNAANDSLAKSTGGVSAAYKALGGVMAALGVGALVNSFKNTVTETERLKGSLVTMTGSTKNAGIAFNALLGFASSTPFTLNQSVESFIKLKSLGLDPSERALQSYGNTAAAMGKDMTQMIEAVADASTGEFERLKEFGIKASSEGDRVKFTFQGVTTEIGKNSAEIQEYLLGIGEVNFGGAMEDQMKRLPGLLSNLSDQVTKLFIKIGDSGGIKLFTVAIGIASSAIGLITENLDILGISLAATAAAMLAFSAGSIASSIISGLGRIKTAVRALNLAIKANPVAFVASAVAAAAVVMYANFDRVKWAATNAATLIEIAYLELKSALLKTFIAIGDFFSTWWEKTTEIAEKAIEKIGEYWEVFRNWFSGFLTGLLDNYVKPATEKIAEFFKRAALNIEVAWNAFKVSFLTMVGGIVDDVKEAFSDLTNAIIATATAAKEAIMDPLNAVDTFTQTYQATLETLATTAPERIGTFSEAIDSANQSIISAKDELVTLDTQVGTTTTNTNSLGDALSTVGDDTAGLDTLDQELEDTEADLAAAYGKLTEFDGAVVATGSNTEGLETLDSILGDIETSANDAKTSILGIQTEIKNTGDDIDFTFGDGANSVKFTLSGLFSDFLQNGKDAFTNILDAFKQLIADMIAKWAASKLVELFSGTFSSIGSLFSGLMSSIGAGIANAASAAVSAVTAGASAAVSAVTGGTAAAAGGAAAAAGGAAATTAATTGATAAGVGGAGALTAGTAAAATTAAATTAAAAGAGVNAAALAAGSGLGGGAITGGFTAGGSGVLAGTTTTTGLATGSGVVSGGAATGASTQAAAAASSASSGLMSVLKVAGPAALFAYLALKWDIFGLNRPNYPTFEELPPAVQASEMLEAFERTIAPSMTGVFPEDTEGQAGFEPMILIDLYQRMKTRLGADASDTLEKIENHPILQNPIYDLLGDIPGLRKGMYNVPHDGFIAELHAGERVMTAGEADSADKMAMDMASLRGSMEEIMIAIARNTAKSYRLYDRWDKNGLPPERAA